MEHVKSSARGVLSGLVRRYKESPNTETVTKIFLNKHLEQETAKELLQFHKDEAKHPSVAFLDYYIRHFSQLGNFKEVVDTLKFALLNNIEVPTAKYMANLYLNLGEIDKAMKWIKSPSFKIDNDSEAIYIIRFVSSREILERIQKLWTIEKAYNARYLVTCYTKIGDLEEAVKIYERMTQKTTQRNPRSYIGFVEAFSKIGDLLNMEKWVSKLYQDKVQLTAATYKAMIIGYLKNKKPEVAEDILKMAISKKELFDNSAICALVYEACFNELPDFAVFVLQNFPNNEINDPGLHSRIISTFANKGKAEKAIEYLDKLPETTKKEGLYRSSFESIIQAFVDKGEIEKAEKMLEDVRTARAHLILIKYFISKGEMKKAENLYQQANNGRERIEELYPTMMFGYADRGETEQAYKFFTLLLESGKEMTVNYFNIMINAYAKRGEMLHAWQIVEMMRRKNITPDANTFVTFINKLEESGNIKDAKALLDELEEGGIVLEQFKHLYTKNE